MKNLFEQALERGETDDFFKGNGLYFGLNRETGEHCYGTHLSGWVVSYINEDSKKMLVFYNAFKKYIASCDPGNEKDFRSVLENVFSYITLQERNIFFKTTMFVSSEDAIFVEVENYLKKAKEEGLSEEFKNEIQFHSDYYKKEGYSELSKIFLA